MNVDYAYGLYAVRSELDNLLTAPQCWLAPTDARAAVDIAPACGPHIDEFRLYKLASVDLRTMEVQLCTPAQYIPWDMRRLTEAKAQPMSPAGSTYEQREEEFIQQTSDIPLSSRSNLGRV